VLPRVETFLWRLGHDALQVQKELHKGWDGFHLNFDCYQNKLDQIDQGVKLVKFSDTSHRTATENRSSDQEKSTCPPQSQWKSLSSQPPYLRIYRWEAAIIARYMQTNDIVKGVSLLCIMNGTS
jgi:hypothetical protein